MLLKKRNIIVILVIPSYTNLTAYFCRIAIISCNMNYKDFLHRFLYYSQKPILAIQNSFSKTVLFKSGVDSIWFQLSLVSINFLLFSFSLSGLVTKKPFQELMTSLKIQLQHLSMQYNSTCINIPKQLFYN